MESKEGEEIVRYIHSLVKVKGCVNYFFSFSKAGVYGLVQPDGQERTVTYLASGEGGFKANVSFSHPNGYMHR